MKRFLKIFFGIIVGIFLLLLLIPVFFKDKIRDLIIKEFDKNTEATLFFDVDQFSLSLIRNFPNCTIGLGDFGIIGNGVFEGDTLASARELEATVDIKEVLFGDAINIKGVSLNSPDITIITLADGTVNYDIMKAVEEPTPEVSSEPSAVNFGIKSFSVSDGNFVYFDQAAGVVAQLNGINISGNGDFAQDIFDLEANGEVESVGVNYDGMDYLTDKKVTIDMILSMDLTNSKYTFKENEFLINDFPLAIDGSFTMLEEAYAMDLSFSSPSSDFKKIFSLIPGAYTESFDNVDASGKVAFSGMVKGRYSETEMPAFNLALNIENGSVQYPDLPESIHNVEVDLKVDNPDGVIENTMVDLREMHVDFGKNPFYAKLKIDNLRDYNMNADVQGTLNLKDLNSMIPMEGLTLDGLLSISAKASGVYDSIHNKIPTFDVSMDLTEGRIQTSEFPTPLENINVKAQATNSTTRLNDTKINVPSAKFTLDGQPFEASLIAENLDDIHWDATAKGKVDLEKLFKIFPMEGVEASGIITADLKSTGKMSDVENERYQSLNTSGAIEVQNLVYKDEAIGKTISVSSGKSSFNKDAISLDQLEGKAGETSFKANGKIENYMGFALNEGTLRGNLNATADVLNIDEWMTSSEEEAVDENGEPLEVVRIPENVDFKMTTKVDKVLYNSLTMNDVNGGVVVKDGKVSLDNTNMKALQGTIGLQGSYDSKPEKPLFAFGFKVKEVSIPASFQSIDMIAKLAPITERMEGLLSTDFSLAGALGADMMPEYSSLTGSGVIQLLQASLDENSKMVKGLAALTKINDLATSTLDRVKMTAEIKDGRLFVKPFDVNLGQYKASIGGSTGIDGSIDYVVAMDVPAGKIGSQLNSLIGQLTGNNAIAGSNTIRLNIGVDGTFKDPKFGLRGVGSGDGTDVKSAVTASVKAKVEEKKEEAKAEVQAKVDQAKDSVDAKLDAKKSELKAKADSLLEAKKDSAASKIADKLGVNKDSTDQKLEEAKKKAESVLKGILKKKKKDNKDND